MGFGLKYISYLVYGITYYRNKPDINKVQVINGSITTYHFNRSAIDHQYGPVLQEYVAQVVSYIGSSDICVYHL